MTEYSDFKVDPALADVVTDVAQREYGAVFRAKSRAGHEALVCWLVFRADPETVREVLDAHDFESIADLVDYLATGRFEHDYQFDPLASVETPSKLTGGREGDARKDLWDGLPLEDADA